MSKVVSGRINNDLYRKIAEDGRSHSDIVNVALDQYYSNAHNVSTEVNKQVFESKYQRLCAIIDGHLAGDQMRCAICGKPIDGQPYRRFGGLNYCRSECWSNAEDKKKDGE